MESNQIFDVAEHLPFKDFLSHISGLSDSLEPRMEEMHKILNKNEAMEFEFAVRIENLKMTLLTPRRGKMKSRQLTKPEKEILKLADLYKLIYLDKEKMRGIRDQSSEIVNREFLSLNPGADKHWAPKKASTATQSALAKEKFLLILEENSETVFGQKDAPTLESMDGGPTPSTQINNESVKKQEVSISGSFIVKRDHNSISCDKSTQEES